MSIETGSIITSSDVAALKSLVATECSSSRRGRTNGTGQWQSNGTLSSYYSNVNGFSPGSGGIVYASDISKMNQPVTKARTNTASSVSSGAAISLQNLNSWTSTLAAKSITSSDHGCAASCTGLCYSGCYSNCSGCTGSCTGSCSGSCSGGCSGGCQGCSGSCSGCSGGCEGAGCHQGAWADTQCNSW